VKTLAVLLPTYNAAVYLPTALNSLLEQTFSDFEVYVYDDCSTDNTAEVVADFKDSRIHYIKNTENLGIAKTLNLGLALLQDSYEFIARMDADDWCYPERFEKQLHYLRHHPEIVLCGTQGYWVSDFEFTPKRGWTVPEFNEMLRVNLLFAASFGHSSVIFRSQALKQHALCYDETIKTCEDWALWSRIVQLGKVGNLPDFLMKYRVLPRSNHRSKTNEKLHLFERSRIIAQHWDSFGVKLSPEDVFDFYYQTEEKILRQNVLDGLKKMITIFNKLYAEVAQWHHVDKVKLRYKLVRFLISYYNRKGEPKVVFQIWMVMLRKIKFATKFQVFKQLIK